MWWKLARFALACVTGICVSTYLLNESMLHDAVHFTRFENYVIFLLSSMFTYIALGDD